MKVIKSYMILYNSIMVFYFSKHFLINCITEIYSLFHL
jgi:hypothetical protein